MGVLSSFNIGITGVNSIGSGMTVTADNIANAQTFGFKSSRPEFQDVLSSSLKGIDGGDQIGSGVKLAHIKPLFTQGSITRTEQVTDLAINGNGFFVVNAPFGQGFSRDGSFQFDREGFLVNGDGYNVLGYAANEKGELTNMISPVKLSGNTIPAKATSKVDVYMNLDSKSDVKQFDISNPIKSSNFNTGLVAYDNVGSARLLTLYFNRVDKNKWDYHVVVDGKDAEGADENSLVEMGSGSIIFSEKGLLQEVIENNNSFNFNKGASQDQKISFSFGTSLADGGNGADASTMYGSDSTVARHTQDGASAASLASLSFNDRGVLSAVYNNGETRDISQVALAKFENNEALFKVGKNIFKATRKSGQGALGRPSEGGRGEVLSKSVEYSNVDIASEFVNLMSAQRNFTANTRTVTTADQMLQEMLGMIRR